MKNMRAINKKKYFALSGLYSCVLSMRRASPFADIFRPFRAKKYYRQIIEYLCSYSCFRGQGLLLFLLICSSCSSGNRNSNTAQTPEADSVQKIANVPLKHHFRIFKTGEAINHISCLQDSAETFCLYLPKDYDTTKSWSVVYFFDAHARGKLPVNKYKELAESYKVILVGSNNSQNGLQTGAYDKIANDLFNTTQIILNISPNKIITAGFSGGGKVEANIAIKNTAVSSVIACGAGLDMKNLGSGYFNYVTIVGKGDFNYWDMIATDQQLNSTPLKHLLLTFDGIHEWPDAKTMSDAISFAMNQSKSNKITIKDFDPSLEQNEQGQRNEFMKAFQTRDASYWLDEISKLNTGFKTSKNESEKWMDRRLLSFINMMSYLKVSDMLNNKQLNQAQPFLEVFKASDPKNPDGPYLTADWNALKDDKQGAVSALNEAMKLGYDDFAHFSTDPMLASIRNEPGYQSVYKKLSE